MTIHISMWMTIRRLLRYEMVYLPLYKVADTPFHIYRDEEYKGAWWLIMHILDAACACQNTAHFSCTWGLRHSHIRSAAHSHMQENQSPRMVRCCVIWLPGYQTNLIKSPVFFVKKKPNISSYLIKCVYNYCKVPWRHLQFPLAIIMYIPKSP